MSSPLPRQLRIGRAVQVLLLAGVVAGCSASRSADYSTLELIEVTGRVTLDGVALKSARVEFESPDRTASSGVTNAVGEYRLMLNSEQSGCLPGEKIVRIRMSSPDEEDPDLEAIGGVMIPAPYNSSSLLRANVAAENRRFDFDLATGEPSAE